MYRGCARRARCLKVKPFTIRKKRSFVRAQDGHDLGTEWHKLQSEPEKQKGSST